MHPPRIPGYSVNTFTKTKAVDQLAEADQNLFERSPDTRSIWRSYQRVEQFLKEVAARMQNVSSRVPLLTKKIDLEPRDNPKYLRKGDGGHNTPNTGSGYLLGISLVGTTGFVLRDEQFLPVH